MLLRLLWLAGSLLLTACSGLGSQNTPFTTLPAQVYAVRDGTPLYADVFVPEGAGPFPAVLLLHGGGWYKGDRADMHSIAQRLAAAGFVAVAISYRFAPAYQFPAQLYDAKEAVRWLRRKAAEFNTDPERIAALGYSAGAHLAMLLAVTDTDDGLEGAPDAADAAPVSARIQAVVAGGTPADLAAFNESATLVDFLGGTPEELPAVYRQASPITYVSADDPPTFLYHGRADWVVDIEQARQLATALEQAKVPVVLREAALGHVATFLFDDAEIAAAIAFLRRRL